VLAGQAHQGEHAAPACGETLLRSPAVFTWPRGAALLGRLIDGGVQAVGRRQARQRARRPARAAAREHRHERQVRAAAVVPHARAHVLLLHAHAHLRCRRAELSRVAAACLLVSCLNKKISFEWSGLRIPFQTNPAGAKPLRGAMPLDEPCEGRCSGFLRGLHCWMEPRLASLCSRGLHAAVAHTPRDVNRT